MSNAPGVLLGSRKQAKVRADGQCEVLVGARRCPGWGDYTRYLLPPERGGKWLDRAWEDYHLIVVCRIHARAFDQADPALADLVIDGEVAWVALSPLPGRQSRHRAVYHGPDPYLAERYPAVPA